MKLRWGYIIGCCSSVHTASWLLLHNTIPSILWVATIMLFCSTLRPATLCSFSSITPCWLYNASQPKQLWFWDHIPLSQNPSVFDQLEPFSNCYWPAWTNQGYRLWQFVIVTVQRLVQLLLISHCQTVSILQFVYKGTKQLCMGFWQYCKDLTCLSTASSLGLGKQAPADGRWLHSRHGKTNSGCKNKVREGIFLESYTDLTPEL